MMPLPIKEAYKEYVDQLSSSAPYQVMAANKEQGLADMAALSQLIGARSGSIRLLRNTTEAINAILHAFPFQANDEIIVTDLDYPHMEQTTLLLEERKGVVIKKINLKEKDNSVATIVDAFQEMISPRTRFMVITHMTHRSGRILPAAALCTLAREHNIRTFVDGAHILGQLDVDMQELGCDYYGSSLHKWMYAPLGTGLLYVKPGRAEELEPSYSYQKSQETSINKYNTLGTIAFQNHMALKDVLAFHNTIGTARKYKRLKYLNERLIDGVRSLSNYKLNSDPDHSCAISAIAHKTSGLTILKKKILERHNINIKISGFPGNHHLRSSVNLHMEEKEIDRLLNALEDVG